MNVTLTEIMNNVTSNIEDRRNEILSNSSFWQNVSSIWQNLQAAYQYHEDNITKLKNLRACRVDNGNARVEVEGFENLRNLTGGQCQEFKDLVREELNMVVTE